MKKQLTEKQQRLYDYIWDKKNWRPPTWLEMRGFLNIKSNGTLRQHLMAIKRRGFELPE